MKKVVLGGFTVLFALVGGALFARHELFRRAAHLPAFTASGWVATVVDVPMRDGVKLHTEVFVPEGISRAPTILVRNPYEYLKPIEVMQCQTMTRFGYACVLQDVRGQMDSPGDWEPIIHERNDGLDTLAWLVKQPFVDGNIGMRGPSYLTCTQWLVSDSLPPEVKTLIPSVFGTDASIFNQHRVLPDGVPPWGLTFGVGVHTCLGRDLDGGVLPRDDADPLTHQYGIVPLLVRELFARNARPDPAHPAVAAEHTVRANWGSYPILLEAPR